MKHGIQKIIATNVGISSPFMHQIIYGKKRPSWTTAKKLAIETGTEPSLWLDGSPEQIKHALETSPLEPRLMACRVRNRLGEPE